MQGKIMLEEAFDHPDYPSAAPPDFVDEIYYAPVHANLHSPAELVRLMDAHGVAVSIVSLTAPGVEAIADRAKAVAMARRVNDYAHEKYVRAYPGRLLAFAAVPLQNPVAAADELERAVTELGCKGALVNGFTNLGPGDAVRYLDDPAVLPFWERVARLDVPVYLHPRVPLPSQLKALDGYPALAGSPWGFGRETAEHALRIILSGLFDRLPTLNLILGHMGEGLTFALPRLEHRLRHTKPGTHGAHQHPPTYYLGRNVYLTTSGVFRTQALVNALSEVGADRLLFSVDYPYESVAEIAPWFDACPIAEEDRSKIGRENARRLFKLDGPHPGSSHEGEEIVTRGSHS